MVKIIKKYIRLILMTVFLLINMKTVIFAEEIGFEEVSEVIIEEEILKENSLKENIYSISGKKIIVKSDEPIYSNESLIFNIFEDSSIITKSDEERRIFERNYYSLSYDNGMTFDGEYECDNDTYEISPSSDGDELYIKFFRLVDTEQIVEEIQEEKILLETEGQADEEDKRETELNTATDEETQKDDGKKNVCKKITHYTYTSSVYHVIFDLSAPVIEDESGVNWDEWVNYTRNADFGMSDLKSGIMRATIMSGGNVLYEYHLDDECTGEHYLKTSVELNEEALDDSGCGIQIFVEDMAGNYTEENYRYFLDVTCPTLTYLGPDNGSINAANVFLSLSGTDNIMSTTNLKYSIQLTKNGNTSVLVDKRIEPENGEIVGSEKLESDGEYVLHGFLEDKAGNKSENINVHFRVDKSAPSAVIEGFEAEHIYQTDVNVRIRAFEEFYKDAVYNIKITREWPKGIETYLEEEIIPASEEYLRNIILNQDGNYVISVSATDAAGNKSDIKSRVRLDKTAPEISIGGVSDKSVGRESPKMIVSLREMFFDTTKITFYLHSRMDGNLYSEPEVKEYVMTDEISVIPFGVYEEGTYLLKICACDLAGNEMTKTVEFTYDCSAPRIGWIDSINKKYLKSFTFPKMFAEMISDKTPTSYKAYLNASSIREGDIINGDGKYVLRIIATDAAGNVSDETVEFIVDKTSPRIIAKGFSKDGAVKKGSTVELSLYDSGDRFESCLYNGKSVQMVDDGRKCIVNIDGTGEHKIEVVASDEAGNVTEKLFVLNASVFSKPEKISAVVKSLTASDTYLTNNKSSEKIDKKADKKYIFFLIPVFMGILGILTLKILRLRQIDTTK